MYCLFIASLNSNIRQMSNSAISYALLSFDVLSSKGYLMLNLELNQIPSLKIIKPLMSDPSQRVQFISISGHWIVHKAEMEFISVYLPIWVDAVYYDRIRHFNIKFRYVHWRVCNADDVSLAATIWVFLRLIFEKIELYDIT